MVHFNTYKQFSCFKHTFSYEHKIRRGVGLFLSLRVIGENREKKTAVTYVRAALCPEINARTFLGINTNTEASCMFPDLLLLLC